MINKYIFLDTPAKRWDNAFPVGMGSMGAMIFGTVNEEKITLNEESIWSGGPQVGEEEGMKESIKKMKDMLLDGKFASADEFGKSLPGNMFRHVKSYEYAGNIFVSMHEDSDTDEYVRHLDLENGIATVSYIKDGFTYNREIFASHPANLICARFRSDRHFSCDIRFEREYIDSLTYSSDMIVADCHTAHGDNKFRVCIAVTAKGTVEVIENNAGLHFTGTEIQLYTSIFTAFKHDDIRSASAAVMQNASKGWSSLVYDHIMDFSPIMNRAEIQLEHNEMLDSMMTDTRLANVRQDGFDPGLISTYFNFGRYLLVSSSRSDCLPANLQGVWSEGLNSPWNADYHTNINLQMNYWHAENTNLSECTNALFTYMNDFLLNQGKETASKLYDARGTVVHHLSDLYGMTSPCDGVWGLWPMGAAWLSFHMWDHYLFTLDKEYLKNIAYEYIKSSALFFIDTMADYKGYKVTVPSTSPENRYYFVEDGKKYEISLTVAPSMDIEMVGELLDFYIKTEEILGNPDPDVKAEAIKTRAAMPPLKVGPDGRLQEWIEPFEEPEPGHRHVSHAFGLYPGTTISRNTPELYDAVRKSLEYRLSFGGGHTGWSRAWLINLFSRLRDSENTLKHINLLFAKSTTINLFDMHPPFQIDGNFGGCAGIAEMVLQSHEGFISLLPALSEKLNGGMFKGLCARGGYEIGCAWNDSIVTAFSVKSTHEINTKIELPDNMKNQKYVFTGSDGNRYESDADGFITVNSSESNIVFNIAE